MECEDPDDVNDAVVTDSGGRHFLDNVTFTCSDEVINREGKILNEYQ